MLHIFLHDFCFLKKYFFLKLFLRQSLPNYLHWLSLKNAQNFLLLPHLQKVFRELSNINHAGPFQLILQTVAIFQPPREIFSIKMNKMHVLFEFLDLRELLWPGQIRFLPF